MTQRVIIVGATGQIGRPLSAELVAAGHELIVFSRDAARAKQVVPGAMSYVAWDPAALSPECIAELESADAVVYLAGARLFDGRRHSRADVEEESRARSAAMAQLVAVLGCRGSGPGVLVAASSVGYYGYAAGGDTPVDEHQPVGADWWAASSAMIERPALAAAGHGVRTVVLRTGYVLTHDSLAAQVAQFRAHRGGWIGTGRGWTPWIHISDEVGIIAAALGEPGFTGPVNLTAPAPVRARAFANAVGRAVRHRAWLPVPSPLVRLGLGVVTDIMVAGQRVVPAAATQLGYQFRFPDVDAALDDLLRGGGHHQAEAA